MTISKQFLKMKFEYRPITELSKGTLQKEQFIGY